MWKSGAEPEKIKDFFSTGRFENLTIFPQALLGKIFAQSYPQKVFHIPQHLWKVRN